MITMDNWDVHWKNTNMSSFGITSLALGFHHSTIFKIYDRFLNKVKMDSPDQIELGCGTGELALRIYKKYGGSVTLVDRSDVALRRAQENLQRNRIKAKVLKRDLFKFSSQKKYDIVHSEGLIEHFLGDEQKKIVKAHIKCLKKDGYLIISVPRPAWYYKIWKWSSEKMGTWPFGFESAMDKSRLKEVLESCGLKVLDYLNYNRYSFALAKI